jgi:folate-binding protein YgfZ
MNQEIYQRILAGEAATFVLAGQALWRLSGPDRERYLNGQVTQDIALIAENRALFAAVCTAKGRMEGAVWIAAHGDAFYLDADPALGESLGPRLEKYLIADDATFAAISDEWTLSHVFGVTVPAVENGFVVKNARFGPAGHDVWTTGTGATIVGESVDADVVETIRLEHAIPHWGAELTSQTLPPEGGPVMLDAISYTKGCYVGQETIARLKSIGHVNRTLVMLQADGPEIVPAGTKLSTAEKEVGTITSGGFSPRVGTGIALAYLPPALATPGTSVQGAGMNFTVILPPAGPGTTR